MDEYKRRRRRSRAVMSMFLDSLGGSIDNVDVATFDSDGTDLKALIVGIEPIQDLHGYDNPWPGGGGTNLLDPQGYTNGLVSLTIGDDINTITSSIRYTHSVPYDATDGLYLSAQSLDNNYVNWVTINLYDSDDLLVNKITYSMVGDRWYSDVIPANTYVKALVQLGAPGGGITVDPSVAKVILAKGTTPVDWTPYSNICPITGHSSVNVIVSPTLNPLDGTITNIPLGTTVYGGTLDVLTGVLMDTNANIASYNGETINEPWISSMDAYSPGATPTIGAQVVYPLSTPQTIQLTGQQIATFLGTNNVWCSSGKIIHLEY